MAVPADLKIVPVTCADGLDAVKALFQKYWDSFGFTPCFQNFDSELATLPGKYAPPQGRLALALVSGAPAGCVALRPIDATRCEAKRLYVRPRFRSQGIGRALLEWVIAEARSRSALPIPWLRNRGLTYRRLASHRVASIGRSATHPAGAPLTRANARRPWGGAYLPGRVANSESKFWKQGVKPNESQYFWKSAFTASKPSAQVTGTIFRSAGTAISVSLNLLSNHPPRRFLRQLARACKLYNSFVHPRSGRRGRVPPEHMC